MKLDAFTDKLHDFFHKRPVLVLVIELLLIGLIAFALSVPAIVGDAEIIRITGYMDTELWYASFAILAIFACSINGVLTAFDEFRKRKRKGDLEHEREQRTK